MYGTGLTIRTSFGAYIPKTALTEPYRGAMNRPNLDRRSTANIPQRNVSWAAKAQMAKARPGSRCPLHPRHRPFASKTWVRPDMFRFWQPTKQNRYSACFAHGRDHITQLGQHRHLSNLMASSLPAGPEVTFSSEAQLRTFSPSTASSLAYEADAGFTNRRTGGCSCAVPAHARAKTHFIEEPCLGTYLDIAIVRWSHLLVECNVRLSAGTVSSSSD